ncbi:hypothetical protein THAOC_12301 [Thalassiosira oceanica]|uniref:Uncharacterized protein n=1 Tax=Thalassiosira oceanica TaxID=159749 RepID=K0SKG4_THAOC|nr:hypothetical protein THAOC_12301 [Thalassiosira oceanica]|eukprot:EJK66748.1 hypothetical protein THAOC_12301 [Thalassiosira oceanica]
MLHPQGSALLLRRRPRRTHALDGQRLSGYGGVLGDASTALSGQPGDRQRWDGAGCEGGAGKGDQRSVSRCTPRRRRVAGSAARADTGPRDRTCTQRASRSGSSGDRGEEKEDLVGRAAPVRLARRPREDEAPAESHPGFSDRKTRRPGTASRLLEKPGLPTMLARRPALGAVRARRCRPNSRPRTTTTIAANASGIWPSNGRGRKGAGGCSLPRGMSRLEGRGRRRGDEVISRMPFNLNSDDKQTFRRVTNATINGPKRNEIEHRTCGGTERVRRTGEAAGRVGPARGGGLRPWFLRCPGRSRGERLRDASDSPPGGKDGRGGGGEFRLCPNPNPGGVP